jgi:hypothetical protein
VNLDCIASAALLAAGVFIIVLAALSYGANAVPRLARVDYLGDEAVVIAARAHPVSQGSPAARQPLRPAPCSPSNPSRTL